MPLNIIICCSKLPGVFYIWKRNDISYCDVWRLSDRSSIMTALTNVTGSHLLDNELFDFKNFAPLVKQIPAGHGSVERELDAVFDHSEPPKVPAMTQISR